MPGKMIALDCMHHIVQCGCRVVVRYCLHAEGVEAGVRGKGLQKIDLSLFIFYIGAGFRNEVSNFLFVFADQFDGACRYPAGCSKNHCVVKWLELSKSVYYNRSSTYGGWV